MMEITQSEDGDLTLKLEGKLLQPWIGELESACGESSLSIEKYPAKKEPMMHWIRFTPILVLGTILTLVPTASPVVAQELGAGHCPGKLEALNVSYRQQLREAECRWIAALAELAEKSSGPEANDAYRHLFNLAIARDLCIEAMPAARSCLASIPAGQDMLGKPAPLVSGTDVNGRQVSLADLRGTVVLVDFWGSWRPPCVDSINALDALAQKYHRQGFAILGVNLDAKHSDVKNADTAQPTARQFQFRDGVTSLNLLDCQA